MTQLADPVLLFTDGGSRGNPGIAGAGYAITDTEGNVIMTGKKYLGTATNNVAEYSALILGLESVKKLEAKDVHCLLDSELIVRQLNGQYRVKHPDMKPLYEQVQELIKQFENVKFEHIPRERNALADKLANEAMDIRKN